LVADLRDVHEWVADKSKARRKHVANPFEDCTFWRYKSAAVGSTAC